MTLREVLDTGKPTIGGWCSIPSAFSAELMGRSGFDWVCIDTQHGLIGYDQMAVMLQALSITGTPALVRVPWNTPENVMKALDAGAQGVIVPMINNADDARQVVATVKYPPLGTRSWGPIRASFGLPAYNPETANASTLVIVMIETKDGVDNLDEILSVPGVDAVYVGPMDLALAHGITPALDVKDRQHEQLINTILEGCQQHGVIAGIHCDSVETVTRWWDLGYRMCTLASDAGLMRAAATQALKAAAGHPLRAKPDIDEQPEQQPIQQSAQQAAQQSASAGYA